MCADKERLPLAEEIFEHIAPGEAPEKWELRSSDFRRLPDGYLRYRQCGNGGGCLGMILLTVFLGAAVNGVPWPYRWIPLAGLVMSALGLLWFLGAASFVVVSRGRILAVRTWFGCRIRARTLCVEPGHLEVVKTGKEGGSGALGGVSIYGIQMREGPKVRLPLWGSRRKMQAMLAIIDRELGGAPGNSSINP